MARTRSDARRWMQHGATLVSDALGALDDADFAALSDLRGWTRAHVIAHLSANAEAVGRLVRWAATGEATPMYSSPEQRGADIEAGSRKTGTALTQWFVRSAAQLDAAMEDLTDRQWETEVITAQGRRVPASETPWMRAREVMVHSVDLGTGIGFSDLPEDFLTALCDDIVAKRSASAGTEAGGPTVTLEATDTGGRWVIDGTGNPALVTGRIAAVAAYLAGRGTEGIATVDGTAAPALPAWL